MTTTQATTAATVITQALKISSTGIEARQFITDMLIPLGFTANEVIEVIRIAISKLKLEYTDIDDGLEKAILKQPKLLSKILNLLASMFAVALSDGKLNWTDAPALVELVYVRLFKGEA